MKRKYSKTKPRFFDVLVSLALLAGQVQYVHTSYFCTQLHESVGKPSVDSRSLRTSADDETCDACQGFIPSYHGQVLSRPNCIQVQTVRMNTVSSFAEAKVSNYGQAPALLGGLHQKLSLLSVRRNVATFPCDASPPLDLPIANCTLRI